MLRFGSRIALVLFLLFPSLALATGSSSVVISELQTGSVDSASQEFVELYNPTGSDLDINGWSLEYKSATGSSWTKKSSLTGSIQSSGFYLISSIISGQPYLSSADAVFSPGLSGTAGQIRIKDKSGSVVDTLGWGESADSAEATPAPAPPSGQSLERLPGRLIEDGGNWIDTDNNRNDFVIRTVPQPQSTASAIELPGTPTETSSDSLPGTTPDDPSPQPISFPAVQLSELFVNPGSPLTDANDEFIELYNPNPQPVDLTGYTLKSGANFHDYYVISNGTIAPNDFYTIYASDSHLSLTNSGGSAELLDPAGKVISQADVYDSAPEGQSWSLINGSWQWTLQPTPGRENILALPPAEPASKSAATKSTSKSASKPTKASSVKTSGSKVKATAAKPKSKTAQALKPVAAAVDNSPTGKWLLIGAAIVTIGYGIYEFRFDLQNFYYLCRRKLKVGRADRAGS